MLFLTPILLFSAFLLLFLVSLSLPIIKSIFLFRIIARASSGFLQASASGSATFGLWGYCLSPITVSVIGISAGTSASCSEAKLGFSFDHTVAQALHVDNLENLFSRAITIVLILHPIACILTFIALSLCIHNIWRKNKLSDRKPHLVALFAIVIAATFASIAFLIDVSFVAVIRRKVGGDLSLTFGNSVWMTGAAALALWFAIASKSRELFACGWKNRKVTNA